MPAQNQLFIYKAQGFYFIFFFLYAKYFGVGNYLVTMAMFLKLLWISNGE